MNNNPIVLALEIGTSKMIAVTGEILNSSEINVLSFGRENPGGVKKADIIDLGKAASLAQSAIEQAQKKCKEASLPDSDSIQTKKSPLQVISKS